MFFDCGMIFPLSNFLQAACLPYLKLFLRDTTSKKLFSFLMKIEYMYFLCSSNQMLLSTSIYDLVLIFGFEVDYLFRMYFWHFQKQVTKQLHNADIKFDEHLCHCLSLKCLSKRYFFRLVKTAPKNVLPCFFSNPTTSFIKLHIRKSISILSCCI